MTMGVKGGKDEEKETSMATGNKRRENQVSWQEKRK